MFLPFIHNRVSNNKNILFPGTPYKKKDFPREYSGDIKRRLVL